MKKNWILKKIQNYFFLKVEKKIFKCQLGASGVKCSSKKFEGDKATPRGKWKIKSIYYRQDKILRSNFRNISPLKLNQITKNCGWCDDIFSRYYNKYIKINKNLPKNIKFEKLWREDDVYDIIVVISYNVSPIIKNKGSAIFIHCSFSDSRKTAGCIALKKRDLLFILKKIDNNTFIKI